MGRTNNTYRNWIKDTKKRWKPFENSLRKEKQKHYNRVFEKGESNAHAATYFNHSNPFLPFLMSIIIEQEKEIENLKQKIE